MNKEAYYQANRERILANVKARYQAKREEICAKARAYQQSKKAELSQKKREYYRKNRERLLSNVKARAALKRDEIAEYKKSWWAKNAEVCRQQKRTRYQENREQVRARAKAKYLADAEFRTWCKERAKEYRANNHDKARNALRRWRDKNREHYRETKRAYSKAHPEQGRAKAAKYRARKVGATIGAIDYSAIVVASRGRCGICGSPVDLSGEYHFDHIVPLAIGGAHSQENLQVAHARCNIMKGAKVA